MVRSLWGVSDTLKAFLPSSVAAPGLAETEGRTENAAASGLDWRVWGVGEGEHTSKLVESPPTWKGEKTL